MTFLWRLVATAIATAIAVLLVPGIQLTGDHRVLSILGVALALGVVNALIKPVTKTLGFCLIVLTLGIFSLVINAAMLMLASWLAGQLGAGIHIEGFWPALFGSIIISIVGSLLGGVLGEQRQD